MNGPAPQRFRRELPSPVPPHPGDATITPERASLYRQVLARRTGRLVLVVEDCYDPHNATAIVRTADALGVQRVCAITTRNGFKINRAISQGSHHYTDIEVFASVADCYARLRGEGFAIWATDLAADAKDPGSLAADMAGRPLALVFGNEGDGVSRAASEQADGRLLVPMTGFPQSLNLSVTAGICLWALRGAAVSADLPGDLPADRQIALYDRWLRGHKPEAVEAAVRRAGRRGEDLDCIEAVPNLP
ncbi:MAG: tRNA ((18)-2-O)-methyltransferase [Planctomycetota bacterium]|jgi:tRNA (guanosine-2'-O-)-methyltransferase